MTGLLGDCVHIRAHTDTGVVDFAHDYGVVNHVNIIYSSLASESVNGRAEQVLT